MQGALAKIAMVSMVLVALGACSQGTPELMNLTSDGSGPDEFLILPTKPLVEPASYETLPEPTPGGTNLTDPTPVADAVEALGGDGARATHSGLRGSEATLVSHAGRYGVSASIRADLAAEDLAWRQGHNSRLLERLFNVSTYFRAYEAMSLNKYLELNRMRQLGVWTPAAPPSGS